MLGVFSHVHNAIWVNHTHESPPPPLERWGSKGGVRGKGRAWDEAGCQAIAQTDRWRMAVVRPMSSPLRSIAASPTFRGLISRCFTYRSARSFTALLFTCTDIELSAAFDSYFIQQWNSRWKAILPVDTVARTHAFISCNAFHIASFVHPVRWSISVHVSLIWNM